MRCDRCCSVITNSYIPGDDYPKYEINECFLAETPKRVYLCLDCSREFRKWLYDKVKEIKFEVNEKPLEVNFTTKAGMYSSTENLDSDSQNFQAL